MTFKIPSPFGFSSSHDLVYVCASHKIPTSASLPVLLIFLLDCGLCAHQTLPLFIGMRSLSPSLLVIKEVLLTCVFTDGSCLVLTSRHLSASLISPFYSWSKFSDIAFGKHQASSSLIFRLIFKLVLCNIVSHK